MSGHAFHDYQAGPGLFHQTQDFRVAGVGNRRQIAVPLDLQVGFDNRLAERFGMGQGHIEP